VWVGVWGGGGGNTEPGSKAEGSGPLPGQMRPDYGKHGNRVESGPSQTREERGGEEGRGGKEEGTERKPQTSGTGEAGKGTDVRGPKQSKRISGGAGRKLGTREGEVGRVEGAIPAIRNHGERNVLRDRRKGGGDRVGGKSRKEKATRPRGERLLTRGAGK